MSWQYSISRVDDNMRNIIVVWKWTDNNADPLRICLFVSASDNRSDAYRFLLNFLFPDCCFQKQIGSCHSGSHIQASSLQLIPNRSQRQWHFKKIIDFQKIYAIHKWDFDCIIWSWIPVKLYIFFEFKCFLLLPCFKVVSCCKYYSF